MCAAMVRIDWKMELLVFYCIVNSFVSLLWCIRGFSSLAYSLAQLLEEQKRSEKEGLRPLVPLVVRRSLLHSCCNYYLLLL
jgi:hypothetical protein